MLWGFERRKLIVRVCVMGREIWGLVGSRWWIGIVLGKGAWNGFLGGWGMVEEVYVPMQRNNPDSIESKQLLFDE